ncbi:MAG: glycosyltransferase [Lachnospiraceae bacterium]|nr:glycosyltransferase [Lachnospiraceae bacterium]
MAGSEPLVSVIVAAYNIESYIQQALDSLKAQSLKDLQIIIVDDGSTDGTGAICDRYAETDPRAVVIHQENAGLSGARNSGLKVARGRYIGFLDGDDRAKPGMFETMARACEESGSEIAVCRYSVSEGTVTDLPDPTGEIRTLTREEALDSYINGRGAVIYNSVWSKLFLASLVKDMTFVQGKNSEDILYTTEAFIRCKSVSYVDIYLYDYDTLRAGSIMNEKAGERRVRDEIPFWKQQTEMLRAAGLDALSLDSERALARREMFYCQEFFDAGQRKYADMIYSDMESQRDHILELFSAENVKKGDRARMSLFLKDPDRYYRTDRLYRKFVLPLRRGLKRIFLPVIFICIFLFLLTTLSYILRTNGENKDRMSGFYAERRDSLDGVIFGSSSVYPFYATPLIYGEHGYAVYPVSTDMQRPAAGIWLTKEVLKYQKDPLFIYEMRMYSGRDWDMTSNMAYTRNVTDNMKYSVNRIRAVKALTSEIENPEAVMDDPLSWYLDIFKYHGNYGLLLMPYEWRNWRYSALSPTKGYSFKEGVGPCELQDCSRVTEESPMPKEQEAYLRETLEFLKSGGYRALFVVSPYLEDEEHKMMYNYMSSIIEEQGYEFTDLNDHMDEIGIDPQRDMADYGTHVNALGAEKVTRYFGKLLGEQGLTDHRGDSAYASWDRAYADYTEVMPKVRAEIERKIEAGEYTPK